MVIDHYARLMAGHVPVAIDPETAFDRHVVACVLTVAHAECRTGRVGMTDATGLSSGTLVDLAALFFPSFSPEDLGIDPASGKPAIDEEEELLYALLRQHADPRCGLSETFAQIVARRAMHDDHLWQDLGLFERPELTRLLNRHFPILAAGNVNNMKWKKYFYRCLCEAEGFSLCTAPSCRECSDFEVCFGEETGISHLARLRNSVERPVSVPL